METKTKDVMGKSAISCRSYATASNLATKTWSPRSSMTNFIAMKKPRAFDRRGIVEEFFGPPWSTVHRKAIAEQLLALNLRVEPPPSIQKTIDSAT